MQASERCRGVMCPSAEPDVDATWRIPSPKQTAYVDSGWCLLGNSGRISDVKGVIDATSGYSGGGCQHSGIRIGAHWRHWARRLGEDTYDAFRRSRTGSCGVVFFRSTRSYGIEPHGADSGTQYRVVLSFRRTMSRSNSLRRNIANWTRLRGTRVRL